MMSHYSNSDNMTGFARWHLGATKFIPGGSCLLSSKISDQTSDLVCMTMLFVKSLSIGLKAFDLKCCLSFCHLYDWQQRGNIS